MRQRRYLNVILTVNAALLTVLVWNGLSGQPVLSNDAHAQTQGTGVGDGVPNAGKQRQYILEAIREIRTELRTMEAMMASGEMKVQVANIEELKMANGSSSGK